MLIHNTFISLPKLCKHKNFQVKFDSNIVFSPAIKDGCSKKGCHQIALKCLPIAIRISEQKLVNRRRIISDRISE